MEEITHVIGYFMIFAKAIGEGFETHDQGKIRKGLKILQGYPGIDAV